MGAKVIFLKCKSVHLILELKIFIISLKLKKYRPGFKMVPKTLHMRPCPASHLVSSHIVYSVHQIGLFLNSSVYHSLPPWTIGDIVISCRLSTYSYSPAQFLQVSVKAVVFSEGLFHLSSKHI